MINFFKKHTYMPLIFSLVSGIAYFLIVYPMLCSMRGGAFLAFMFLPAIVFGSGLIIIKMLKNFMDMENEKGVWFLVVMHIIVFIAGISTALVTVLF